jgi:hypothetical protein
LGEVRLSPPICVVSLVAVALTAISIGQDHKVDGPDIRCVVAAAYLDNLFNETYLSRTQDQVVIFTDPERLEGFGNPEDIARLKNGEIDPPIRDHPLIALYRQAARQNGVSAIKFCPEVRAILRRSDISKRVAGDETLPNPIDKDGEFKFTIVKLSVPAVDPVRGEAIMFASQTSATLAGGGFEVYLRRDATGKWFVLYEKMRWVS